MIELNSDNFNKEVIERKSPILVCFLSYGCSACQKIYPILEEVSKTEDVGVLNIYEDPDISKEYGIFAVPTIIIFKNGTVKEKAVGIREKNVLINKINSLK